jgi:hypothetical protein
MCKKYIVAADIWRTSDSKSRILFIEKITTLHEKEHNNMPLSSDDIKVSDELSRLLKKSMEFRTDSIDPIEYNQFQMLAENILEIGFGANSSFYKRFLDSYNSTSLPHELNNPRSIFIKKMPVQVGILQAAFDALNMGLTKDLFYEREMIVFSDLLDQAYEFLESQSTYLAAGVYGRIVLETAIREFAKLKLRENYSPEMKFDQIIIKLKKERCIQEILENRLRDHYKIGSHAAHNNEVFKNYSKKDLKDFLTFIKDNVLTLN